MRIAQVPTMDYQVPPEKYGAVHSMVYDLSKYLADQGHEVTIFADAKSRVNYPGIKLVGIPVELIEDPINPYRRAEINQFLEVFRQEEQFDIVHWHYDPIALNTNIDGWGYNFLQLIKSSHVITLHFSPQHSTQLHSAEFGGNISFYEHHPELTKHNYISISNAQRRGVEFLNFKRTIYHGIDLDHFHPSENSAANPGDSDYLLFIGRLTAEKGILAAIEVAKRTQKKLKIAGRIEPNQQDFFDNEVKPAMTGGDIEFLGEIGYEEKVELYQNALAMLFPIEWEEPFGLVLIESLACGTPVIAYNRGSVPEVIADGKTGFVVNNLEEMVAAVAKLPEIDRAYCRQEAQKRFSVERMVQEYAEVYSDIKS